MTGPDRPGVLDRVAELLAEPARRATTVVAFAYCSAVAGLVVTLVDGSYTLRDPATAAGVALMFLGFILLFYASVSVATAGGE